jgi:anti-anti-sigma regulatory factor
MSILLPSLLKTSNYRECLAVANQILENCDEVILLDASVLYRVDPFGLSLLASVGSTLASRGAKLKIINLRPELLTYLSRMDLLTQSWILIEGVVNQGRNRLGHSLVELSELVDKNEVDSFANRIADAILGGVRGLDPDAVPDEMTGYTDWEKARQPLCYAFTELLNNALTHGRRNGYKKSTVWVSAQYFRATDQIAIGIVDNGCSILGSLESHPKLISKTDSAALWLALEPRISCNRDLGIFNETTNAGIGLTTTYRIARAVEGAVLIISGSAAIEDVPSAHQDMTVEGLSPWQGTILSLRLNRSDLMKIDFRALMPPRDIPRAAPGIRFE